MSPPHCPYCATVAPDVDDGVELTVVGEGFDVEVMVGVAAVELGTGALLPLPLQLKTGGPIFKSLNIILKYRY